MEALGESHDACLQDIRSRITTEKVLLENKNKEFQQLHEQLLNDGDRKLILPESINAREELTELQKSCHPGFVITFDSIDFHLSRRNMSMSEQNRDVHWVNHSMVENRVSENHLLTAREKDILDIPNIQFLPSVEDQRQQRMNNIIFFWLTTKEKEEIIKGKKLTDDSRFPCRFQGCPFSFKFDEKSRKKHELTHNPPPVIEENLPITSEKPDIESTNKANTSDDMFNYNCFFLFY